MSGDDSYHNRHHRRSGHYVRDHDRRSSQQQHSYQQQGRSPSNAHQYESRHEAPSYNQPRPLSQPQPAQMYPSAFMPPFPAIPPPTIPPDSQIFEQNLAHQMLINQQMSIINQQHLQQQPCFPEFLPNPSWLAQLQDASSFERINSNQAAAAASVQISDNRPSKAQSDALDSLQLPADKITESGIIPDSPYYELPAGLMVPLVKPSQREYKPLNPNDLRLPFPTLPNDNFLRKIDLFFTDADRKHRDSEGWDAQFMDTYRKQKEALAELS